jgi:hypothetical protein
MKKLTAAISAISILTTTASAMNGTPVNINVTVNGTQVVFEDQQPIILNDRTLLPVRGVMEAMGKTVSWDEENNRAIVTDGITTVSLGIGDETMLKTTVTDGLSATESITLDSVPVNVNDRTLLPIRAVAESFGATVNWDALTTTVSITG